MIKACAWFNIVAGILVVGLALLVELLFVWISRGLGGGPSDTEVIEFSIPCAGVAAAGSGKGDILLFSGMCLAECCRIL